MEITASRAEERVPVTILKIEGDIDMHTVDQFDQQVQQVIDNNEKDVLLDLSGVSFISSAGIRSLSALYYQLHPETSEDSKKNIHRAIREGNYKAPHLKLLNPQPRVFDVLETVGISMFIPVYYDETEALAAF
jgi:anti-anti-sigma factor